MAVTAQIIITIGRSGDYSRSQNLFLYKTFFDNDIELNAIDFDRYRYFFSIGDIRDFVTDSIETYFSIEETDTIERYNIPRLTNANQQEEKVALVMDVVYIRGHDSFVEGGAITYNLTRDDFGPFDIAQMSDDELRYFISNTTNFRIEYLLDHTVPSSNLQTFD
jgi:hypothetical protein